MKEDKYNKWIEIPKEIMDIKIPTRFYDALNKYLVSIDDLYRVRYVEGNHVKVCKGFKI